MDHLPLLKRLVLITLLMFAFAFALVPLYDVFCQVTGLNGKPNMEQAPLSEHVVANRKVSISFMTNSQAGAPFQVTVEQFEMNVELGEMYRISFDAKNLSKDAKVMQAVPSVSPGIAAKYLHKVSCFCFSQQPMLGLMQTKLPLLFYIDPELPPEIEELTLSYAVFDISDNSTVVKVEKSNENRT